MPGGRSSATSSPSRPPAAPPSWPTRTPGPTDPEALMRFRTPQPGAQERRGVVLIAVLVVVVLLTLAAYQYSQLMMAEYKARSEERRVGKEGRARWSVRSLRSS